MGQRRVGYAHRGRPDRPNRGAPDGLDFPGDEGIDDDGSSSVYDDSVYDVAEEAQAMPTAPPGWHTQFDSNGRVYYVNDDTQETSWTRPQVAGAQGGSGSLARLLLEWCMCAPPHASCALPPRRAHQGVSDRNSDRSRPWSKAALPALSSAGNPLASTQGRPCHHTRGSEVGGKGGCRLGIRRRRGRRSRQVGPKLPPGC